MGTAPLRWPAFCNMARDNLPEGFCESIPAHRGPTLAARFARALPASRTPRPLPLKFPCTPFNRRWRWLHCGLLSAPRLLGRALCRAPDSLDRWPRKSNRAPRSDGSWNPSKHDRSQALLLSPRSHLGAVSCGFRPTRRVSPAWLARYVAFLYACRRLNPSSHYRVVPAEKKGYWICGWINYTLVFS